MEPEPLSFVEIVDIRDDRLLPWLDLYETAFPASERVLVSAIIDILKKKMAGDQVDEQLILVLDKEAAPIGMTMFNAWPESPTASLWYLAVTPNRQARGIGTCVYQEIVRRVSAPSRQMLVYEVEIPNGHNAEAQRRIRFYRRQGAYLLTGIHYMQDVGWHQSPIPMHIMVHPLQPMDARQAFDLARRVFGDSIWQVGPLKLE